MPRGISDCKELLVNHTNPIIINYRISSQFIPGNHWVFDPKVGGGPIIAEFCHFIDLILFLLNSEPVELIAYGGAMSHKSADVFDSCVVMMKFSNGSIGNLIYTDLNGPNMPKERIEIYSGDSAIIIDDFKTMITSGFDFGNIELHEQDKGHKNEIDHIIKTNLGLEEPLVKVEDAMKAMDIVFKTINSIKINAVIKINTR
jgi:predicted dehydrogenase